MTPVNLRLNTYQLINLLLKNAVPCLRFFENRKFVKKKAGLHLGDYK